eukprot:9634930-Heterocapsa_arctica.AAC.1
MKKKGLEVLYMGDPVDEYDVQQLVADAKTKDDYNKYYEQFGKQELGNNIDKYYLEKMKKKGLEGFYMGDPVDELGGMMKKKDLEVFYMGDPVDEMGGMNPMMQMGGMNTVENIR